MTSFQRGAVDTYFGAPFVDVDEWRDDPVRHRYVHGGFEDTETRFSMYFPPAERYEGRFFHPVMPVSGTEHGAVLGLLTGMAGSIDFALASGAYLVESNQGRPSPFPGDDPTIAGFRASAAVARYSRVVAAEMYGEHRPFGYVYGGSGGAFKTMSCFENAIDVWDGAVPYVHGTAMSLPNMLTIQAHAIRVLRDKIPMIVDAVDPGGSGDMFAGLNVEERQALNEATRMGFPPRMWFDVDRILRGYTGVWSLLVGNVVKWDPQYFEDFWTVPGYLGADAPESLARVRVEHATRVTRTVSPEEGKELGLPLPFTMSVVTPDSPVALRVESLPEADLQGATLTIKSGNAAGRIVSVVSVVDGIVVTGFGEDQSEGLSGVAEGDDVLIDNTVYLASQTYHRHQVPPEGYLQWDQFRVAGRPIYPQRPRLLGPGYARQGAGSLQSGRFAGKMIVVESMMDEAAYACGSVEYRRFVQAALGDGLDDQYRIWFVDHAMHTQPVDEPGDARPARTTRVVSYLGVLQQALRDVAAWVEQGLAPPASTEFEVHDGQIVVPSTAAARKGIQAVVHLTANGGARADVSVGETVRFSGVAEAPRATGTFVAAEWDFDGAGTYPVRESGLDGSAWHVEVTTSHTFDEPGTYFPALRVTTQRQGDVQSPYARVQNLARCRVVVSR